jgi:hypothetical protein
MSDFKQIGQIMEGHFNNLLHKAGAPPDDTARLSELRMADCLLCEHTPHPTKPGQTGPGLLNGKYCNKERGGCGCDMHAKSKVISATCPIGRW